MKKIFCLATVSTLFLCGGCASTLLSMIGGAESPRPKEYQVDAAKEITTTSVKEVMKGQLEKQDGIEAVAIKALDAMKGADTKYKVAGITNVVANTANEIRRADGSAKLLSQLSGRANKSISEMSALEYMAYAGSQTAVAMGNRETAAKGIKAGFELTKSSIAQLAGGGVGVGGLLALGIGMLKRGKKVKVKDSTLKTTGNTINKFASLNPEAGKKLKEMMAKATSTLPINANEEFGV